MITVYGLIQHIAGRNRIKECSKTVFIISTFRFGFWLFRHGLIIQIIYIYRTHLTISGMNPSDYIPSSKQGLVIEKLKSRKNMFVKYAEEPYHCT